MEKSSGKRTAGGRLVVDAGIACQRPHVNSEQRQWRNGHRDGEYWKRHTKEHKCRQVHDGNFDGYAGQCLRLRYRQPIPEHRRRYGHKSGSHECPCQSSRQHAAGHGRQLSDDGDDNESRLQLGVARPVRPARTDRAVEQKPAERPQINRIESKALKPWAGNSGPDLSALLSFQARIARTFRITARINSDSPGALPMISIFLFRTSRLFN